MKGKLSYEEKFNIDDCPRQHVQPNKNYVQDIHVMP